MGRFFQDTLRAMGAFVLQLTTMLFLLVVFNPDDARVEFTIELPRYTKFYRYLTNAVSGRIPSLSPTVAGAPLRSFLVPRWGRVPRATP